MRRFDEVKQAAHASVMDYSKVITIEAGKRSGKNVLEYLAGGMTQEEIRKDFPELTQEDIRACLAFAADRERKLFIAPA